MSDATNVPSGEPADPSPTNALLRAAIAAFAQDSDGRNSTDVLRHCLHGELLLDITGSDVTMVGGEPVEAESLEFRIAETPDGSPAVLAFTSVDEIRLMHPEGTDIQALGQPATAIVELACAAPGGWLYLDPGGTTCAMPQAALQLAAEVPRNDAVREALDRPDALVGALRANGVLLLAADPDAMARQTEGDLGAGLRTGTLPDGSRALLVFTSAPELLAHAPQDAVVIRSTAEVLTLVRDAEFAGVLVNAAGPSAMVMSDALLEQ